MKPLPGAALHGPPFGRAGLGSKPSTALTPSSGRTARWPPTALKRSNSCGAATKRRGRPAGLRARHRTPRSTTTDTG
eukprot:2739173-Alexandrium_andersonii.AAC.1